MKEKVAFIDYGRLSRTVQNHHWKIIHPLVLIHCRNSSSAEINNIRKMILLYTKKISSLRKIFPSSGIFAGVDLIVAMEIVKSFYFVVRVIVERFYFVVKLEYKIKSRFTDVLLYDMY